VQSGLEHTKNVLAPIKKTLLYGEQIRELQIKSKTNKTENVYPSATS